MKYKFCELGDKYLPIITEFSFVNSRKLNSSVSHLRALLDDEQFFVETLCLFERMKCTLTTED